MIHITAALLAFLLFYSYFFLSRSAFDHSKDRMYGHVSAIRCSDHESLPINIPFTSLHQSVSDCFIRVLSASGLTQSHPRKCNVVHQNLALEFTYKLIHLLYYMYIYLYICIYIYVYIYMNPDEDRNKSKLVDCHIYKFTNSLEMH